MARGATFSLGEAVLGTAVDLDGLDRGLENGRRQSEGFVNRVGSSLQSVGRFAIAGLAAASTAVVGFGGALAHLAIDAAPLATVRDGFAGIAEASGTSMDEMLAALERGSAGMVAQSDLMETFNKAAQLVGNDFAVQLPDAMESLRKVAAATGQDMGYLLDSLVTGVGRLSPMILDNLAIQVDVTAANEAYAAQIGKTTGELTKQEQQTALMNQVLELLADNTANLPDVLGTAQQGVESFRASMQNLKDRIGLALQPALQDVMGIIGRLADRVLPPLVNFIEDQLVPAIESVTGFIRGFFDRIDQGMTISRALKETLLEMFPEEFAAKLIQVIDFIHTLIDALHGFSGEARIFEDTPKWAQDLGHLAEKIHEVVAPIIQWIGENVKLSDILIALAITIAAVIIPAVIGIIAAIGEVILIFAALVAAIAFVRKVWTEDFLGIRTFMENTWNNVLKPIFQAIGQAARDIAYWWDNSLMPAMRRVWDFLNTYIFPVLEALNNVYLAAVGLAIRTLAGIWQNVLMPPLRQVADFIDRTVGPIFDRLRDKIGGVQNWVDWLIRHGLDPMWRSFAGIINIIKPLVDWLNNLANRLSSMSIPSWARPGSPSPFEMSLRGIGKAMRDLSTQELPAFTAGLELTPALAGGLGGGGGMEVHNHYNLTVNTSAPREDIVSDFGIMKVLAGA